MGLDLADVKTFKDEVPKVPKSAYDDLEDFEHPDEDEGVKQDGGILAAIRKPPSVNNSPIRLFNTPCNSPMRSSPSSSVAVVLVPMFAQLGSLPNFHDLLRERNVCLERAVGPPNGPLRVKGVVWVRNLAFEKNVTVRWTANEWADVQEVRGHYVDGDGFADRFEFEFCPPPSLKAGQRVQMCLRFEACGVGEFWDSNGGQNYVFQTYPATCQAPPSAVGSSNEDPWWTSPI